MSLLNKNIGFTLKILTIKCRIIIIFLSIVEIATKYKQPYAEAIFYVQILAIIAKI